MGYLEDIKIYNATTDNKCIICITKNINENPTFFVDI